MPPSLSITNILQALYEDSPTIKMYVDTIAAGQPAPYTLITKSTEHEKNEKIVKNFRKEYEETKKLLNNGLPCTITRKEYCDVLAECLDEAMIFEEEEYTIIMFKEDAVVEGSRQIVTGDKIEALKDYAKFKGFNITIKKVE